MLLDWVLAHDFVLTIIIGNHELLTAVHAFMEAHTSVYNYTNQVVLAGTMILL